MAEDPTGHRICTHEHPSWPNSSAAFRFHDVQLATCSAAARAHAGRCRQAHSSSRSPSGAAPWAGCYGLCPPPWPERMVGGACWTSPPTATAQGSLPMVAPATAVASGTAPTICTPSSSPVPPSTGLISAPSERPSHRSGFGFGSVPSRSSLVHLTTMMNLSAQEMMAPLDECRRPSQRI